MTFSPSRSTCSDRVGWRAEWTIRQSTSQHLSFSTRQLNMPNLRIHWEWIQPGRWHKKAFIFQISGSSNSLLTYFVYIYFQLATGNKIVFLNSFKLKLSIIFGVIHMIFGVCLSVFNHLYLFNYLFIHQRWGILNLITDTKLNISRHFRNYASIVLEFIPQIVFLTILFFYLVVLIIIKWLMYSAKNGNYWHFVCCVCYWRAAVHLHRHVFLQTEKKAHSALHRYSYCS